MADYVRTATDLAHPFYSTLSDANGPVDLPSGTSVTFEMRLLAATTPTTNSPAVVVSPGASAGDPNRGLVRYDPVAQDVAKPGIYYAKWRVQYPTQAVGSLQSFPESSFETIVLLPAT